MIPPRIHGGPDHTGAAPHDFSTNANACGPSPHALAAVQAADATRYPDPAHARLRTTLAAFHAIDPARLVVAASASEFIFRITGWAAQRGAAAVAVPVHAYGDYAAAARAWNLQLLPPDAPARLRWTCEPASPLGGSDAGLAHRSSATTVLDRAYEPLRLAGACSLGEARLQQVWQLWSPNKALGLTGVRGAYAIAPTDAAEAVAQLEALAPSWPLGAQAVAMLQAWCDPAVQQWLQGCRVTLRAWKDRQSALCAALRWEVHAGSCANFFVVQSAALVAKLPDLRRRGIGLRDCASFGLPGHVRMAVLPPASQDALAAAWKELR